MLILTLRTDKPEAEIGIYNGLIKNDYYTWPAHRQLAETIHKKLRDILAKNHIQLYDLEAIAVYRGPGSFTGLRIGISVANALADGLKIPIVGSGGDVWIKDAVLKLEKDINEVLIVPEYGSLPHITKPKR
jgi:tRNA threonylcarbamoyladenosine biosynthesis protein TsaB